jgi:prepilin signal peptidase PulO-like enzyme (type II secretory pathway)
MLLAGFLIGSLAGTVIAVLLDRLYTGAAWCGPVLPCAGCRRGVPRAAWLGLPGFFVLGGRCPACGRRLPARLVYLPLVGGATFALAFTRAAGLHLLLVLLFLPPLLALTAADFERRLLPNRIMYPTLALALLVSWAWPDRAVGQTLVGGLIGFGAVFAVFLVLPGFGFGDVKLAGLVGLLAGSSGVLSALLWAAIAAGAAALLLVLTRRAQLHGAMAYGPYLALAAFLAMLAG